MKDSMKDNGFQRVLVSDGGENIEGHGTFYMKTVCEDLQRQI